MQIFRSTIFPFFLVLFFSSAGAQDVLSDNGDGTYTNPVIPADFPDPDVIRVGDMYYMVTTTMFVFPGVTVLKSHDLVNWEYCSNAVPASISVSAMTWIAATVTGMVGLAVFQDPYAYIGVKQAGGTRYIIMVNNGKTIDSVAINKSTVYLRTIASNSTRKATFDYSFDNKTFIPLGNELVMRFNLTIFTGNKFCLFNYATKETGGYVDFDWMRLN